MRPEDMIERVWPGLTARFEPLGGGITNHNFKIEVDEGTYVLRIGGKDTDLLGIDRETERAASEMAAELGVGPEVVAFIRPEGYLVTRFLEGRPIPPEEMRTPAMIARVGGLLRAVHGAAPIPGRFDAHRVVEVYADTAARHGVQLPDDFDWAHGLSGQIEAARGPQSTLPCHNDLLNANFILDARGIRLVDWEYAGMGDRFFDLANFSINHDLEPEQDAELLRAYFGHLADVDVAAVGLMRFMSDFREAMWGVVQQGISELGFDFQGYAADHFDRLHRIALDPSLERWLDAVSGPQSSGIS